MAAQRGISTINMAFAVSTDISTGIRRATALHVPNLVLHKLSFRSSEPIKRKRDLYSKMFPDSAFTGLSCGKTKANYIAVQALAP